jgi:hypothetical protein
VNDVPSAEGGHRDRAIGDLDGAEAQGLRVFHIISAVTLDECDLKQRTAGEGQHLVLGE